MATYPTDDFFPDARHPDGTIVINESCLIRTQSTHRVVMVCGLVLVHYAISDTMSEAYAMVSLVEQGWADQNDVARAFNCSVRTVMVNGTPNEFTTFNGVEVPVKDQFLWYPFWGSERTFPRFAACWPTARLQRCILAAWAFAATG